MQKILLYQVYTDLSYVPLTYRRVKKLRFIIINKYVCKSLARKNGNYILILSWNNPTVTSLQTPLYNIPYQTPDETESSSILINGFITSILQVINQYQ